MFSKGSTLALEWIPGPYPIKMACKQLHFIHSRVVFLLNILPNISLKKREDGSEKRLFVCRCHLTFYYLM